MYFYAEITLKDSYSFIYEILYFDFMSFTA